MFVKPSKRFNPSFWFCTLLDLIGWPVHSYMYLASQVGLIVRHDGDEIGNGVMAQHFVVSFITDLNIICLIVPPYIKMCSRNINISTLHTFMLRYIYTHTDVHYILCTHATYAHSCTHTHCTHIHYYTHSCIHATHLHIMLTALSVILHSHTSLLTCQSNDMLVEMLLIFFLLHPV